MGRRLAILLVVLVAIGTPAAALRVRCAGASCRSSAAAAPAPFCSLPADLRALITAGTYEGRSPDVLGVAANTQVTTPVTPAAAVPWPSTAAGDDALEAPLAFLGRSVAPGPLGAVELDQVAPTIADAIGLRRADPNVRAGTPIAGVVRPDARTPLVVMIVWKGVGRRDVARSGGWRAPAGLPSATGSASVGSVPVDPTAVEATIGTGGLPWQHGITGTWIRGTNGRPVRAFAPGSPQPVIATLGDDLDRATGGRALIGLVGDDPGDAGLTGDAWYGTGPVRDRTAALGGDPAATVRSFLSRGWGADATTDLLAVALDGNARADEAATARIVRDVVRRAPDALTVAAGTGSLGGPRAVTPAPPAGTVGLPNGGVAGGYFLDRSAGPAATSSAVVDAIHAEAAPNGSPLYADAFAAYAVRFGRYC
jgi:hypothetical protein